jgi:hypothetical protein
VQLVLAVLGSSDTPAVQAHAHAALEAAGRQYEDDHAERLRDLCNYGCASLPICLSGAHVSLTRARRYVLSEPVGPPLQPPYAVRPRLGTRLLVSDCATKIVPAALADVASWTLATRCRMQRGVAWRV